MDARTSETVPPPTAAAPQLDAPTTRWRDAVPVVIVLLSIGLADAHYGAFTIDRWAPLAVFVLLVLAMVAPGRRIALPARVPLIAIGAFAGWSLLSVAWAQMPGVAFEGGARNALLAGLFALPIVTLRERRTAQLAADLLVTLLGLIVGGMLIAYLVDPGSLFLAGPAQRITTQSSKCDSFALTACAGKCLAM